jgi:hypothetical protein
VKREKPKHEEHKTVQPVENACSDEICIEEIFHLRSDFDGHTQTDESIQRFSALCG